MHSVASNGFGAVAVVSVGFAALAPTGLATTPGLAATPGLATTGLATTGDATVATAVCVVAANKPLVHAGRTGATAGVATSGRTSDDIMV